MPIIFLHPQTERKIFEFRRCDHLENSSDAQVCVGSSRRILPVTALRELCFADARSQRSIKFSLYLEEPTKFLQAPRAPLVTWILFSSKQSSVPIGREVSWWWWWNCRFFRISICGPRVRRKCAYVEDVIQMIFFFFFFWFHYDVTFTFSLGTRYVYSLYCISKIKRICLSLALCIQLNLRCLSFSR